MADERDEDESDRTSPPERPGDYDGWLLRLFEGRWELPAPVVAGAVSVGLFVLGAVVAAVLHALVRPEKGFVYHERPLFYTYAVWMFFLLWLLSHWSRDYLSLWERVRPAFDASDEQYDGALDRGLSLAYRLEVPLVAFVPIQAVIAPVSPLSIASEVPLPETLVFEGFQVVTNFLLVVFLYLFVVHVLLVRRVLELPLSNVYGAATELEPIAEFSVSVAIKYFANLAVFLFAAYFLVEGGSATNPWNDLSDLFQLTEWSVLFSVLAFGAHLLVGVLVFFVPVQLIHDRLRTERRDRLVEIYDEYDDLFEEFLEDEDAEGVTDRMEELDRIRDRTERIETWPFQLPSLVRMVLSSLPPVVMYLLRTFVS